MVEKEINKVLFETSDVWLQLTVHLYLSASQISILRGIDLKASYEKCC